MAIEVKRATLFDPKTGKRTAVDVGSPQSRELFGQGYQLETPNSYSTQGTAPVQDSRKLSIGQANDPKYWNNGKFMDTPQPGAEAASAAYAAQSAIPYGSNGFVKPPDATAPVNPYTSFNSALASLLSSAKGQAGGLNEDLQKQRNDLIQARFNTRSDETPTDLRGLSPERQAVLRNQGVSGLETQLGGVDAALKSREAATTEARSYLKDFNDQYQEQFKPIEIDGQIVQLNPETGQYEVKFGGTTQDKLLSISEASLLGVPYGTTQSQAAAMGIVPGGSGGGEVPTIKTINGADYQWNGADQSWNPISVSSVISDAALEKATLIKNLVTDLLEDKSVLGNAVGPISSRFPTLRGKSSDFENKVESLKSLLTLDNLGLLKGAMSDKDLALLQSAGSTLNLNMSEEGFIKELNRIKLKVEGTINTGTNDTEVGLTEQDLQILRNQGISEDEIKAYQQSFSNDLSTSQNGSNVSRIVSAIGQFESGGNYKAVGPATSSGDHAYGKYQVMGTNIPSWTKEALGRSLSINEFYNDPKAQDAVAEYKMGQYFKKYGTVEDVASAWFSGRPLAKAGNAKDVIGTSVPQYVRNIRSLYDSLG